MWTEPKTDWKSEDTFSYSDYNRIKNNIAYLEEMAGELYISIEFQTMGEDKTGYQDNIYADEVSAFEDNLELLRNRTFPYDDSEAKQWYENQTAFNYEDANRIERACLNFYNGFVSQKSNRRRLSFRLGTRAGAARY